MGTPTYSFGPSLDPKKSIMSLDPDQNRKKKHRKPDESKNRTEQDQDPYS